MTEILRFEMNVPAEVTLKDGGPGKPIEGRYGNRVMYTLVDGRVMYVAPFVADRISELGIQPGEAFHVCKHLKKQGQKRLIEWQLQRCSPGSGTQIEQELRESIEVAKAAKDMPAMNASGKPNVQPPLETQAETALPSCAIPVSDASDYSNLTHAAMNGDGSTPPVQDLLPAFDAACINSGRIQESPMPPVVNLCPAPIPRSNGSANGSASSPQRNGTNPPPVTTKLEHALKTAISAAYNAEKYGAELGYVVRFDADAIKSMAITVLINMSEGNRR